MSSAIAPWIATAEHRPDAPYLILMGYRSDSSSVKFGYLHFRLGCCKDGVFYESVGLSWYSVEAPSAWLKVPTDSFDQLFNP